MRPILLAMNNPISSDPRHALYPWPSGCAGNRLWQLLSQRRPDVRDRDYLRAFDRRNLVAGKKWSRAAARTGAELFMGDLMPPGGSVVLVLGEGPREALGFLPKQLVHPFYYADAGITFRQLPHPSGRCRWYNDPTNRLLAGMLLEELYEGSV